MEVRTDDLATHLGLDHELVAEEFPPPADGSVYLNTGSCGRKPRSVLKALAEGYEKLNLNPTLMTFLDPNPWSLARHSAARLFESVPDQMLLTQSTTQGLQLIMQSFLRKAGDEVVTTSHEHTSTRTILRHLENTRGVVIREHQSDPFAGSLDHCLGILGLVTERTKLVVVSEIECFTGWRPDLSYLVEGLSLLDVPLLVDGAHSAGQGLCRPSAYPLWVGSGHKWLGGPNGTGFAYVAPNLVPMLEPVWLGDKYFELSEEDMSNLKRFESQGTTDVVKWLGLTAACDLQRKFGIAEVAAEQLKLAIYLRERLIEEFNPHFRTPAYRKEAASETTSMVTFYFDDEKVKVDDLRKELWEDHRVWVQPDFLNAHPGHGMRIACHVSNTKENIEELLAKLKGFVK